MAAARGFEGIRAQALRAAAAAKGSGRQPERSM